ncbi:HIT family protein [candidate division CSSED10-310 bacterium]|uniref:HIT family protein n=1 Tax=candidate division CSSED10-310 bacterium TaxID=2855610 RepID=A0ABV6Z271_UNCC1
MEECLACRLTQGMLEPPGGKILATRYWIVEHCVGPLGVGTLILKPVRHCVHFWELTAEESREVGPLLQQVAQIIREILNPDQIYICLWSHANWEPGHIHFVLQPVWNKQQQNHRKPGAFLQAEMFQAMDLPDKKEAAAFVAQAKEFLA